MAASDEQLALDGLDLNIAGGNLEAEVMQFTPAKKRYEWQDSTDDDGSVLIRDPKVDNSRWDLVLNVHGANRDAAQDNVGLITAKLEEAERFGPGGIPLVWTPANSSDSRTFYVLSGEITEIPISHETGYFSSAPNIKVSVTLYCRPFNYGAEILSGTSGFTTTASTALITLSCASALGDVPAEARLVVTDAATQNRDYVAWGLEHRYQAATDLLLTQPDLTNSGFAGTSSTHSGSVSTNVWRAILPTAPAPLAICGTGNQGHIGSFRVMGRCGGILGDPASFVRLAWKTGDGPFTYNPWVRIEPTTSSLSEVDLGAITIPPKILGTQRWQGQVEAYSETGSGTTFDVDYLALMPTTEGYGKAKRTFNIATPTTYGAWDGFDQTSGALNGKTLPSSAITWATSGGDPDDFNVSGTSTVTRATTNDGSILHNINGRVGLAGAPTYTNVVAQCDVMHSAGAPTINTRTNVIVRRVDASNYLMASIHWQSPREVELYCVRAGVEDQVGYYLPPSLAQDTFYTLRIAALANGRTAVWVFPAGSTPGSPVIETTMSELVTGGTHASGQVGIGDLNQSGTSQTRTYNDFKAWTPAAEAVCFSSQSIEFRSDETLREDSTGTYWGPPQTYRGAPFYLPPAGDENRTSRVAVIARRQNIDETPAINVTDSTTVAVNYTPRYLYLPR